MNDEKTGFTPENVLGNDYRLKADAMYKGLIPVGQTEAMLARFYDPEENSKNTSEAALRRGQIAILNYLEGVKKAVDNPKEPATADEKKEEVNKEVKGVIDQLGAAKRAVEEEKEKLNEKTEEVNAIKEMLKENVI